MTAFIKRNPDLLIAACLCAAVLLLTPFNPKSALEALNLPLLIKLFCLMAVVAAMREAGILQRVCHFLMPPKLTVRSFGAFMIACAFFFSMLFTNDVALIIFVPLCILGLKRAGAEKFTVFTVVWQTVAANLGSMLTPMGNPQNLYIFDHYRVSAPDFLAVTLPVTLAAGIIIFLMTLRLPKQSLEMPNPEAPYLSKRKTVLLTLIFLSCIASVLRFIPPAVLLVIVVFFLNFFNPKLFLKVDFKLLLLFMLLFLAVDGLTGLPALNALLSDFLQGGVFWAAALLSQLVSNVPCAVLLSGFTSDYRELLLGVSIGGLGTLIASMASLISYKFFARAHPYDILRYLGYFTAVNFVLLAFLGLCAPLFLGAAEFLAGIF